MESATLEGSAASGAGSLRATSIHDPGQPASKPCSRCHERPEHSKQGYCLECRREYYREYREKHRERIRQWQRDWHTRNPGMHTEQSRRDRRRHPIKARARNLLGMAVYDGRIIKPAFCENCGDEVPPEKLHGHHDDYSKPFEVKWMCHPCHITIYHKERVAS